MALVELWRGDITLPPLPERKKRIGRNIVRQVIFRGANTKARIFVDQLDGHFFIKTELKAPYDELFIRKKGARKKPAPLPVITVAEIGEPKDAPKALTAKWDNIELLVARADTPDKVLETWANQFNFRLEGEGEDEPGLRLPQIGALHAIAAHFSVGRKFEPATVVLPTGTGKTETMLATQVYMRPRRTLVLVSGVPLRRQIEEKFFTLGYLPTAKAICEELPGPRVGEITGSIRNVAEAQQLLDHANLIIAFPNSLAASDKEALAHLTDGCSDLFIDEAHHAVAGTWNAIRERFADKKILQFTATPFRRDGKRVDGKIIFNYKLGDAQAAGYYKKIGLKTVEEYGEQEARDEAIATEAIAALRHDLTELKLDHILMARTETQPRANTLYALYQRLAPDLKPVVVYSELPDKQNREALKALKMRRETGSRIVICVNMLGEGFDFSQLKIAALHDTHKSLAITLQFIGRFTRKGPKDVGDATVVTNIADQDAEKKLAALYAEGADWDQLIRRLSEERIQQEIQLQDVVQRLKTQGDLASQLSLWNLRPSISTQFYKTKCSDWTPLEYARVLPKTAESWHALDDQDNLLVAVVARTEEVDWGNYQNIANVSYDLVVARWDKKLGVLALYASDYEGMRSEQMAKAIVGEDSELFSGNAIFNILNGVQMPLVKSLGSRSVGAISFTNYFGTNVTDGLANIDKSEAELSHVACVGYEDGERVLWGGAKRRGKVWQLRKSGSVADWVDWTKSTWSKVTSEDDDVTNITKGFLRPQKMLAPHASHAIGAQWGERAQLSFHERQAVLFGETERLLFEVEVDVESIEADGTVHVRFASEAEASVYRLAISAELSGGYEWLHVSGPKASFRRQGQEPEALEVYLERDPVIIRYADGTHSYNCYHIPMKLEAGIYPKDQIEAWDFTGIPLNAESMGKDRNQATIQYRALEHLHKEYDLIFNDDGPGEAADLVCLKNIDDQTIRMTLVHCKGAIEAKISGIIDNFYVVCGQAQKSITAKHEPFTTLVSDLKRRESRWMANNKSRFLKGGQKELSFFKEKARRSKIEFEVVLVQPGANEASLSDDILRLIATTELYLKKTTQATFRVVINAAK